MSYFKGKWVPHSKGAPGKNSFEISVVREDNDHGFKSYGWFKDDEKRLITHNGGPCNWPISEFVWCRAMETAKAYADYLNHQEDSSDAQA